MIALLAATATRAFAVQTYTVPSESMVPTLTPGDRIAVDKLASTLHRGDIIVFAHVKAEVDGPPNLVKRIIGLPGETISSVGEQVLVNGKVLPQPWLPRLTGSCTETAADIKTTKIAPDNYFVMGDCRGASNDSRVWGTVPARNVVGKVDLVFWRGGHPWLHWF